MGGELQLQPFENLFIAFACKAATEGHGFRGAAASGLGFATHRWESALKIKVATSTGCAFNEQTEAFGQMGHSGSALFPPTCVGEAKVVFVSKRVATAKSSLVSYATRSTGEREGVTLVASLHCQWFLTKCLRSRREPLLQVVMLMMGILANSTC